MTAERVTELRENAEDALGDLSQAGVVGLAAMSSCVRSLEQIRVLTPENAAATLQTLRDTKRDLDMIAGGLDQGRFTDGFEQAFRRIHTVVDGVVAGIEREQGGP